MSNVDLFFYIYNLNGQFWLLDQLMIFATSPLIYIIFLLILLLGIKGGTKEKKALLLIVVALPIAVLLIKFIHIFLFEPRPFVAFNFIPLVSESPESASFPSRHATIAAVFAFAYTYFKSKWWPIAIVLMLWIGLSRIYVGVHYPLDVVAGFSLGGVSVFITAQIMKLLKKALLSV